MNAENGTVAKPRGRPKENRELKKRISLSVFPSLYDDIQKIAHMQKKSTSDLIGELMEQYRDSHKNTLTEHKKRQENG